MRASPIRRFQSPPSNDQRYSSYRPRMADSNVSCSILKVWTTASIWAVPTMEQSSVEETVSMDRKLYSCILIFLPFSLFRLTITNEIISNLEFIQARRIYPVALLPDQKVSFLPCHVFLLLNSNVTCTRPPTGCGRRASMPPPTKITSLECSF